MTAKPSLQEFLRDKKRRDDGSAEVDWSARKAEYLERVEELYADVARWLEASVEENVVQLSREKAILSEEHIGQYEAESLILLVGQSRVRFRPVGRNIVGANGRVDMMCGPHLRILAFLPGRGWHFVLKGPVARTWPVTEESFAEVLREMLRE